jgi:serine protease AprX
VVSSGKYDGVAQSVRFVVLKVLDRNGKGKTSSLIDSIEYVIANKDRLGIHVINLSLGHPIFESAATDPLVQAVERASRAGLIVVAAAGNVGKNPETGLPGYGGIASPGNAPSAITVGAANTLDTAARSDDRVAGYSSRGPSWYDGFAKPDVVAPGHLLVSDAPALSTLSTTYPSLVINESQRSYLKLSGTSMSTGGSPPL